MPASSEIQCYTRFLKNLSDAILLIDIKGKIQFINDRFIHITGYSPDNLVSISELTITLFNDKKQANAFGKFITKALTVKSGNGVTVSETFTIRNKDNNEKSIRITAGKFNNELFSLCFIPDDVDIGLDSSASNSEHYYKQIVDLANVAILKFDKNFIITDFTGNSEHIFGYKKSEVIGKSLYDSIVPEIESTGKDLKKLIKDLIFQTKTYEYNVNENIRKNGERIWMQWYNTEIRGKKNELQGVLSIGIDISDRINAELALKESEHRFKMLSNLTFEGIIIHDNGIIQDYNLSLQNQIGYTRKELIGMNIFEKLISPEYHELMKNTLKQKSAHYEATAIHKDGTRIPVSIESRIAKINDKYVRVAAVRDISDLKRTIEELNKYKSQLEDIVAERTQELRDRNEQLQFERNQLRTIIDNIPDIIYIKDRESKFLNINKRLIRHFGKRSLKDIIGKTDHDFYPKEYADEYLADEQKILKTGISIINKEEPCLSSKGKKIIISTTKVPLKDKSGEIVNIVGIGKDITYKIKAEIKLKQQAENLKEVNARLKEKTVNIQNLNHELNVSNKNMELANKILQERKEELETTLEQLKNTQTQLIHTEKMASLGVLMAGIAHEINNPVNFIYAGVNSVMKDFDDIKIVCDQISVLREKTNDTISAVNNIINLQDKYEFSVALEAIGETLKDIKLGATRISEIVKGLSRFTRMESEEWKATDLHEELENVLILLKNKYKHNIEIERKYSKNLPLVQCYPGKMNQVFMNVINNAIDAIDGKKGTITIRTEYAANKALISIKDTGKGIEKKNELKIFDPFFTTKEVGFGMGLGLAISYTIIQEHSGEIRINSKLNRGTEMIIELPVIQQ
jgi:PAS domain S-box-containing protein